MRLCVPSIGAQPNINEPDAAVKFAPDVGSLPSFTALPRTQSVAFDVAYKLVRGGTLPEPLYRLAVATFGQHGTNELIYPVGLYSLVYTTLCACS